MVCKTGNVMVNATQIDRLEKLAALHREGALSDAEFELEKARILAEQSNALSVGSAYRGPGVPAHGGSFLDWAMLPLRRYADFEGRSRRKEYWMFSLGVFLLYVAMAMVVVLTLTPGGDLGSLGWTLISLFLLGTLGLFIPGLAVQVRRFHDQDKSGWLALINFLPYLGALIVLIFMCLPGTVGPNRFGPDPIND